MSNLTSIIVTKDRVLIIRTIDPHLPRSDPGVVEPHCTVDTIPFIELCHATSLAMMASQHNWGV